MKIGILTFVNAVNYGALFQMLSLWNYIKENCNSEVEIINYDSKRIRSLYYPNLIKEVDTWREYIQLNYDAILRIPKVARFKKIYRTISISRRANRDDILHNVLKYQKIIVGSDQVWNSAVTLADDIYYLPLNKPEVAPRKFSYAASFGNNKSIQGYKTDVVENLKDFELISVREKEASVYLKETYGIEASTVVDPVFLNNKEFWESFAAYNVTKPGVVFVYTLMNYDSLYECLEKYPDKANKKFVIVSKNARMDRIIRRRLSNMGVNYKIKSNMSPQDFLGYIKTAEMTITDSFHATALSILMQNRFICLYNNSAGNGNTNGRLNTLLSLVGLENRVYGNPQFSFTGNIDYDSSMEQLHNAIDHSKIILNSIIKD